MAVQSPRLRSVGSSSGLARDLRRFLIVASVTLFALMVLTAYLSPFAYMTASAFKDLDQFSRATGPLWPAREATYAYEGEDATYTVEDKEVIVRQGEEYPLYQVPTEEGTEKWALVVKRREESFFLDPNHLERGLIQWTGRWRTLEPAWRFSPTWNVIEAWGLIKFPRLLRNTAIIAILGDIGTLLSCTAVAYGFSRFRIPGKNILFIILIGTIILPSQVTLVPTYAFFTRIGWTGTFLPLIVPHFFANAYNVFLLRQYFMTIPRDLDEAAMIDGASPFRVLVSVILPQSIPVLAAVAVFHLVWAWNDYFQPYLYLSTRPDLQPISVGIQQFNTLYSQKPHMVQATSLMGLLLPVVIFFLAQRAFMRGVVITGVEK